MRCLNDRKKTNIFHSSWLTVIIVAIIIMFIPKFILSHSGRTDSSGCHTNRTIGEYHCHNAPSVTPPPAAERVPPAPETVPAIESSPESPPPVKFSPEQRLLRLEQLLDRLEQKLPELEKCLSKTSKIIIDKSTINAFHNDYRRDPGLTIDNNRGTFWHSDNMTGGERKWLAYEFPETITISAIELINDYVNFYAMGELKIIISQDSTNGEDGTWTIIKQIPGDTDFPNGESKIIFDSLVSAKWVKLEMTFQGRGAHGSTPAFYLSEINFFK